MVQPLMPMATAVWLVDNTTLTFRQIGRFCGLHPLEVQGIADETVGQHMVGLDPTLNGQLTRAEIARCQADASADLHLLEDEVPAQPRTKGPRYTPVSKRQDKPDAIAWLLRYHPEISDAQISRLVGTTKPTIQAIRDRSHWNIQNIKQLDPVALGLCSQIELDEAVTRAAKRVNAQKAKEERAAAKAAAKTAAKIAKTAAAAKAAAAKATAEEAAKATAEEAVANEAAEDAVANEAAEVPTDAPVGAGAPETPDEIAEEASAPETSPKTSQELNDGGPVTA